MSSTWHVRSSAVLCFGPFCPIHIWTYIICCNVMKYTNMQNILLRFCKIGQKWRWVILHIYCVFKCRLLVNWLWHNWLAAWAFPQSFLAWHSLQCNLYLAFALAVLPSDPTDSLSKSLNIALNFCNPSRISRPSWTKTTFSMLKWCLSAFFFWVLEFRVWSFSPPNLLVHNPFCMPSPSVFSIFEFTFQSYELWVLEYLPLRRERIKCR